MEKGTTNNPNGRPKGSLNKKNQEIQDLAKEMGCNPAKILMLFAMGDRRALGYEDREAVRARNHELERQQYEKDMEENQKKGKKTEPFPDLRELEEAEKIEINLFDPDTRTSAAKELMPYLYGKRKPVDSDGNDAADPITELVNAFRNK